MLIEKILRFSKEFKDFHKKRVSSVQLETLLLYHLKEMTIKQLVSKLVDQFHMFQSLVLSHYS